VPPKQIYYECVENVFYNLGFSYFVGKLDFHIFMWPYCEQSENPFDINGVNTL